MRTSVRSILCTRRRWSQVSIDCIQWSIPTNTTSPGPSAIPGPCLSLSPSPGPSAIYSRFLNPSSSSSPSLCPYPGPTPYPGTGPSPSLCSCTGPSCHSVWCWCDICSQTPGTWCPAVKAPGCSIGLRCRSQACQTTGQPTSPGSKGKEAEEERPQVEGGTVGHRCRSPIRQQGAESEGEGEGTGH